MCNIITFVKKKRQHNKAISLIMHSTTFGALSNTWAKVGKVSSFCSGLPHLNSLCIAATNKKKHDENETT